MSDSSFSRRKLLQAGVAGATSRFALPMLSGLAALGHAQAATASDYKALVCIFLNGGNDHWNTVVPHDDANYASYARIRSGTPNPTGSGNYKGIALLRDKLLPLEPAWNSPDQAGRRFALNPALPQIQKLFNDKWASIVLNVGPLNQITTQAQYRNGINLPDSLYSHNDQAALAQSIVGTEGARSGWGGRVQDQFPSNPLGCIAVGGGGLFLSGANTAFSFGIGADSAPSLPAMPAAVAACYRALMTEAGHSHMMLKDYSQVGRRAFDNIANIRAQVSNGSQMVPSEWFPSANLGEDANPLAKKLRMVARLIAANHNSPGRQVFYVSMGGFDSHDHLVTTHPKLLGWLDSAVREFATALSMVGAAGKVSGFTASDFGRTLWSNGDGSDHGWGAHHFVFSGDPGFRGGHLTGIAPDISNWDRNSAAGKGRLIPTTSLEQMAMPLARWFGVTSPSELAAVFPNAGQFNPNQIQLFN